MINKISETTKQNTIRKSVKNMPTQPSAVGITEQQLKDRFVGVVTDPTNSAYAEIDRVVDEANAELQARDNAFNEHINNAEIHKPNVIEKILVNGAEKQPDIDKAVNITAEDLGADKPNGLATLDENQRLKTEQLPEGINVYEYYDSIEDFPETGESGVTYVDRSTNNVYLWTGSDYTNITAQLALGETSNTAYRGDRGKTAYDHSQSTGNPHQTAFDEILDKPTTLAGYGITDALKKGDQSKVVNDAFANRITATNDIEIIDSPLGTKTATIKSIKGVTIKAVQQNGNFVSTSNWISVFGLSASNNTLTCKVLSLQDIGLQNDIALMAGHRYYVSVYIKAKYANTTRLGIYSLDGTPIDQTNFNPTANQWVHLTAILSAHTDGAYLRLYHNCSYSYAVNDTIDVRDFRIVDLSESSVGHWTKTKLDGHIPRLDYWEGFYNIEISQFKSIGDNLLVFDNYNKTETVNGMTLTTYPDGRIKLNGTATASTSIFLFGNAAVSSAFYAQAISCLKGQGVKYVPNVISGTHNGSISFVCHTSWRYAANNIAFDRAITAAGTGVLVGDITGFRIYISAGATADNLVLQPMLLHADNPLTEYKPYTEHILELPQYTLRSLPDGTADEITPMNYIQRIDPETMTALEEPIYTPIEWDNTYPAWNYGLEQVFDTDGNPTIAQMEIEYPLDLQKQVDTNTWIAQRNEGRIAQNEADINTLQSSIGAGYNEILYEGDHNFLEDGTFYPSNFEFEIGSTYALEFALYEGRIKTEIFTFAPGYGSAVRLSFVSVRAISDTHTDLDVGILAIYANRIATGSLKHIYLNHVNDDIQRSEVDVLVLKRVIKLR